MQTLFSKALSVVSPILLAASLSACGGGDSESSSATSSSPDTSASAASDGDNDACALITKDEAAAALGGPVSDANASLVGSGQQASDTCRYELLSDATIAVHLTILHGPGQVQLFQAQVGDPTIAEKKIAGLGDGAWCTKEVLGLSTLAVLKGEKVLQLTGTTCDPLEKAARVATPRLK